MINSNKFIKDFQNILKDYTIGYEDEPEIILFRPDNSTSIHLWDGYFTFIMNAINATKIEWSGFTKDYHELVRSFNQKGIYTISHNKLKEYIKDWTQYYHCKFDSEETREVYLMILAFLMKAHDDQQNIVVQYIR